MNNSKGKNLTGKVIKNSINKSTIVHIKYIIKHKIYNKYIKKTTKIHIHDEKNICKIGNIVLVKECRPISKTKSWNLVKIIK